jgi:predicted transcriptional regulator
MTAKQLVLETVEKLSDDATLAQIIEEIAISESIRKGIEDVRNGRVVPDEEVQKRIAEWFTE